MNVEELINRKKEEIIEEVKQETEGLHESISNIAVEKLEKFAAELKTAIGMNPIGAADLLRVIEKGGFVYQRVVYIDSRYDLRYDVGVEDFLEDNELHLNRYRLSGKKQRLTIIIEPLEE